MKPRAKRRERRLECWHRRHHLVAHGEVRVEGHVDADRVDRRGREPSPVALDLPELHRVHEALDALRARRRRPERPPGPNQTREETRSRGSRRRPELPPGGRGPDSAQRLGRTLERDEELRLQVHHRHRRLLRLVVEREGERRVPRLPARRRVGRPSVDVAAVAPHRPLEQVAALAQQRCLERGRRRCAQLGRRPVRQEVAQRDPAAAAPGTAPEARRPHRERVAPLPQLGQRPHRRLEWHIRIRARVDLEEGDDVEAELADDAEAAQVDAAALERGGVSLARVANEGAVGAHKLEHRDVGG
mmetsp:Transcript_23429/g.79087  ORF Transcript_23429/g.79087 Transcript_23429/m.79087 type:complete len:302 (-) Transcript_23429:504-1409(-)